MSESSASTGGINFFGALTILFIGLKLTDNIEWSWLWVLSPLWIPIAILLIILSGIFMAIIAATALDIIKAKLGN